HLGWAKPCARPDLLDATPPDGATSVPTNAVLHAHYHSSAQYLGEDVALEHVGIDSRILQATFDSAETILSITPTDPLVPGDSYIAHWPALRGIGTASLGVGQDVHFTAGAAPDTAPPVFGGVVHVAWDARREHDDCEDADVERYVFNI